MAIEWQKNIAYTMYSPAEIDDKIFSTSVSVKTY